MLKIGGIYNTCMTYTYFIVVAKDKKYLYYYIINKKFENISNSAFNFLISSYINSDNFHSHKLSSKTKLGQQGYIGKLNETNLKLLTEEFEKTEVCKRLYKEEKI